MSRKADLAAGMGDGDGVSITPCGIAGEIDHGIRPQIADHHLRIARLD